MEKRVEKFAIVMTAISPWRAQHKGQNFAETIECPACKGRLHLSITRSNGHVWGRCTTPDCVSWVE